MCLHGGNSQPNKENNDFHTSPVGREGYYQTLADNEDINYKSGTDVEEKDSLSPTFDDEDYQPSTDDEDYEPYTNDEGYQLFLSKDNENVTQTTEKDHYLFRNLQT